MSGQHTPMAQVAEDFVFLLRRRDDDSRWPVGTKLYAASPLIKAAPELLAACANARDMLAIDRQSFVDCQRLRDTRTEDPIAHGLVGVEDGVWLDSADAEALRDYDRALALIDGAIAKATGSDQ